MIKLRNVTAIIFFISIAMLTMLTALTLFGCNNDTQPRPPSGGDPATVIKAAHNAMMGLKSFHFTVEGTKNETTTLTTLTIEGDLQPPDKGHSTYQPSGK